MTNRLLPVAILGCVIATTGAEANPQGGTVVGGQATITQPAPNDVTVKQQSSKAIIDWQSFSIGKQESVQFNQPSASSVALNRVVGNDLSTIAGSLSANGIVFLVNPNGVVFTRTAKVDVNGLIASTNDIANADFKAGKYNFTIPGAPGAGVVNDGTITAAQGGLVGLVAPWVRNDGVITAQLGRISLASGDAFTVDLYGDQLIQFAVPVVAANDAPAPKGALVTNTGTISAKGGTVALTADTAERIVDEAINTKGIVEASAVHEQGGEIVLDGGPNGGVTVAGTLDASGKGAGQTGGTVKVLGANVALNASATVNVSGDAGGGTVLVGGDFHGAGPDRNATRTKVALTASIDADALNAGNGGQVAVWSDDLTTFDGTISARGGSVSGNGGFVEVSGHQQLTFDGSVDLLAPMGTPGTLLLDPENVTIAATGDTPTLPSSGDTMLTGTSDNSVLAVSTLLNALSLGNVTVQTGTSGSQAGDIEVATNIGWTSGNSLTLSAYRNITVDDGVTISNVGAGNLSLRADNTGTGIGTVAFTGTGKVDFSQSTGAVAIYYNPADNLAGSIVNTASYTAPTAYSSSVFTNSAVPNQLTAHMLVNSAFDLQNIQNNLSGDYALGANIDAGGTATWNSGAGFVPLGSDNNSFSGVLNGLSHTISNLHITSPAPFVGLVGLNEGSIRDVSLANVQILGTGTEEIHVGGLVGANGDTISNVDVTGSVSTGTNNFQHVGGIAGENDATISSSGSSAVVSAGPGANDNGHYSVGGLVGSNFGTIEQSWATGNVSGHGGDLGGLVGYNTFHSMISQSFATGTVSDSDSTNSSLAGGLAGWNQGGTIQDSYATGNINPGANGMAGGLVELDDEAGIIVTSYSTGKPTGAQVGGLVDRIGIGGGSISNSYWDVQTSGQSASVAGTGLTTAQLQSGALPEGFNANVWNASGGQYPTLKWQIAAPSTSPTIVTFGTGTTPPPNPTPITWDVANASSTYGTLATLGDATLFGVSAGDSGSVEGTVGLFSRTTPLSLSATLSAGTYTEEVTGLTDSAATKYVLSPTGDTVGTLTISPKQLTWNVANASAPFGTVPTLGAETLNGVLTVDAANVYGTIGIFSGTTPIALSNAMPVGSYAERITVLTGLASSNYTLAANGNSPGTLTVNPGNTNPPPNTRSSQQQQVLTQVQSQTTKPSAPQTPSQSPSNPLPPTYIPSQAELSSANGIILAVLKTIRNQSYDAATEESVETAVDAALSTMPSNLVETLFGNAGFFESLRENLVTKVSVTNVGAGIVIGVVADIFANWIRGQNVPFGNEFASAIDFAIKYGTSVAQAGQAGPIAVVAAAVAQSGMEVVKAATAYAGLTLDSGTFINTLVQDGAREIAALQQVQALRSEGQLNQANELSALINGELSNGTQLMEEMSSSTWRVQAAVGYKWRIINLLVEAKSYEISGNSNAEEQYIENARAYASQIDQNVSLLGTFGLGTPYTNFFKQTSTEYGL